MSSASVSLHPTPGPDRGRPPGRAAGAGDGNQRGSRLGGLRRSNHIDEALRLVESRHPDVVIIDLSLDGEDGIELIDYIKSRWPAVKILVYSSHDEEMFAGRVLRAGAMGYVSKCEPMQTAVTAVRQILRGEVYLSPRMAASLLQRAAVGKPLEENPVADALASRVAGLRNDGPGDEHGSDRRPTPAEPQDRRIAPQDHQDQAQRADPRPIEPPGISMGSGKPVTRHADCCAVSIRERHRLCVPWISIMLKIGNVAFRSAKAALLSRSERRRF